MWSGIRHEDQERLLNRKLAKHDLDVNPTTYFKPYMWVTPMVKLLQKSK